MSRYTSPFPGAFAPLLLFVLVCVAPLARAQIVAAPPGQVEPVGPVTPAKTATAVYLVQLREPAAAAYRGGIAGFPATRPVRGRGLDAESAPVASYARRLEQAHDRLLVEVGAADSKLYSYRYAVNGFAARLTPTQAARLAQNPAVERVTVDRTQPLRTNNSAVFLGLETIDGGLRAEHKLRGEDIVIGIIDSGIAPEHPALSDVEERIPRACNSQWARTSWLGLWLCHAARRRPPTVQVYGAPAGFNGACEEGERFAAGSCNNKLVGARFYVQGFLASHELDPGEFLSPRDADGHGTHIATTAAGNAVTARLFGTRVGRVAGIAPRARIAVYKACWLEPGAVRASCTTSDLTRAIDDAVADGVHLINFSVGSTEADLTRPDDLALLTALEAGVLSIVAAGNDGPELGTIASPAGAPWVLTAAASTQSGTRFEEAIEITAPADLAGHVVMREASFTPQLRELGSVAEALVLVDDGQDVLPGGGTGTRRDACEPLLNAAELSGRIALIERGGCEFQFKLTRVEQAGAIGAVVYSNVGAPIVMNGDRDTVRIPAVMIGTEDGHRLVDRLVAGTPVHVRLSKGAFAEHNDAANRIGAFSSRGPARSEPDFLKPDVTAPGINILAGHTPDVANGLQGETFQYLTGTSMAAPEVVGIAALLRQKHPEWSPAMLKSALVTSAHQSVTRHDGDPAHAFDTGAGHVDANRAVDPGLVYDTAHADHAAYLCSLQRPPFPPAECEQLALAGFASEPRQLNLPSIGITRLVSGDSVRRRVTNVGPPATYSAQTQMPSGIDVIVDPPTLHLGTGQTAEFTLTFQAPGAQRNLWSFGRLRWSDGTRTVTSPMALRPVTLRAPEEVHYTGVAGSALLPVAFGYDGPYLARVHGLRPALVLQGHVDQDPARNFSFRFTNGVTGHFVQVPANHLYVRFALFDELTDGADDLDLYLFYCPQALCRQVGQSGAFTSDEQINLVLPQPGLYVAMVHGFETDPGTGPGANYSLLAWGLGLQDDLGNLEVVAPGAVLQGQHLELELEWTGLSPASRYLGVISHDTPDGLHSLTIVNVDTR